MRPRLDAVAATSRPPADEGMAATEAAMLMAPADAEAAEAAGADRRRHAQAQGHARSPPRRQRAPNARGLDRHRRGGATTSRRRNCRRHRPAPGEGGGIAPRRCAAAAPAEERRGAAASKRGGADASGASPGAAEGSASGSSSSDSSSEDSSDNDASAGVHPSMAPTAMAMWPGAAPGAGSSAGVEVFLSQCPVDPEAADRMRVLPPHLQQVVMARGPVSDTRNPSAVLIARVRDAELGRGGLEPPPGDLGMLGGGMMDGADDFGGKPARKSAKVTIEAMILEYRLSPGCAWMLRALPPDKQKMASRIDPSGQADPSGYVAEQMKKIV
mmetsp:Transcript_118976/g.381222  ORF Transcript_118976/g.381222 Transcript_118976/m.381222 type:complete len:328 (-) Transcript_118976:109-1092(-)